MGARLTGLCYVCNSTFIVLRSMFNAVLLGHVCSIDISAFATHDDMFDVCNSALFYMRNLRSLNPQNDSLIDRLRLEDMRRTSQVNNRSPKTAETTGGVRTQYLLSACFSWSTLVAICCTFPKIYPGK